MRSRDLLIVRSLLEKQEFQLMTKIENGSQTQATTLLYCAWMIAFVSSVAVLFIGEIMGQTPCNLCWFQRSFMFPLAVILGVAIWNADLAVWKYAAPLAGLGAIIALYHTLLYLGAIPKPIVPCEQTGPSCTDVSMTIFGLPIPALALVAFGAILLLLIETRRKAPK